MLMCCYPGCRTGYLALKIVKNYVPWPSQPKDSLYLFPKVEKLKKKWLRVITRVYFVPSKHSRVCSRHFHESCFRKERKDSNSTRAKQSTSFKIPRLKLDAVPKIFPESPAYFSKLPAPQRSTSLAPFQKK
ncbi:THAP2 [Lepeophtheirus salmonis]|uniref:THAP2 n=1 Tax=Lepeophtheirus salmonis TaxID=72036 RepID=A0A7R8H1S6_LEPSM|nr:THAP2 [Lepeophtheirus salmonis]CAF2799437.1 THAP2 [Lepeophtheirus salmonis]